MVVSTGYDARLASVCQAGKAASLARVVTKTQKRNANSVVMSCGYIGKGSIEDQEAIDLVLWTNGFQTFFHSDLQ